jgi:hypothetical protein
VRSLEALKGRNIEGQLSGGPEPLQRFNASSILANIKTMLASL